MANLDAGGTGIFTGPDIIDNKLIGQGDALLGSTIGHPTLPFLTDNVGFFRDGLNDSGELAFWARLIDGREAIVRATPRTAAAVPEPGTLAVLAASLAGLFLVRRRKA